MNPRCTVTISWWCGIDPPPESATGAFALSSACSRAFVSAFSPPRVSPSSPLLSRLLSRSFRLFLSRASFSFLFLARPRFLSRIPRLPLFPSCSTASSLVSPRDFSVSNLPRPISLSPANVSVYHRFSPPLFHLFPTLCPSPLLATFSRYAVSPEDEQTFRGFCRLSTCLIPMKELELRLHLHSNGDTAVVIRGI